MIVLEALEIGVPVISYNITYIEPLIKNANDQVVLSTKCNGAINVVRSGKTKKEDILMNICN